MSTSIAIVGGGIGGLTTAGFLHRSGFDVTVYEQAHALTEIGAGLIVAPNAMRVLRDLGPLELFRKLAVELEIGWEFHRWEDGRVLFSQQLGDFCVDRYGEGSYVAHRADLLDVVRAAVPESSVRLKAKCVSVRPVSEGADITFADGSTVHADIVIGADGIHSTVAEAVTAAAPARYSGMCAYRCMIPVEKAPEFAARPAQALWVGPDHHLVHYPISSGRLVNVVAFAPDRDWKIESWTAEGRVEDLVAEFADWDPRLRELLTAAERTGRWALLDREPLPQWTSGPITLLGDAAHPMFPFFGQGGAQALEDAAVLAGCLAQLDPLEALARYEKLRLPRATRMQLASRGRERVNHLPDGPEQEARDAAFAREDPLAHNSWIYSYDAVAVGRDLDEL